MATTRSVGMMDPSYFVGRNVVLGWLNDLLQLNLGKIEETASGAVACQVVDSLFKGKIPMQKVNWGARTDYEFVANYKLLQNAFDKLSVDKQVPVDRLVRAKYQDNLEFMQWLKCFFDDNSGNLDDDYDAVARRNLGKGVSSYKPAQGGAAPARKPPGRAPAARKKPSGPSAGSSRPAAKENVKGPGNRGGSSASPAELKEAKGKVAELEAQIKELQASNADLKMTSEGTEKERDFYFQKLRDVELLLQSYTGPDRAIVKDVLKVLYATEDDVDGDAAEAAAEAVLAEASAEAGEQAESLEAKDRDVEDAQQIEAQPAYAEEY